MATTESLNNINTKQRSDEVTLRDLIIQIKQWCNYLISKWVIILIVGVVGAILGLLYSSSQGVVYKATTTFVLEDSGSKGGLGQYSGLAAIAGIDMGGGGGLFSGDNILELYKSRSMIKKALLRTAMFKEKEQTVIDRYIEFNDLREKWAKDPKLKDVSFSNDREFTVVQDSILNRMIIDIRNNNLFVNYFEKTKSIIEVEVKGPDALFAKAFNESIVATVNEFYIQTKAKKSLENLVILQHQVDSVKAVLNGSIFSSAATMDATPNLNPTRQVLRAPVERSRINAETNKVILAELVKNLEISRISVRKEMPLIQVIDYPVLPLEIERMSKSSGIILGGFLSGFLIIFILSSVFFYKKIMSSE
ncbi:GumC domain-containing protein [Pedobacter nyackensis]|uniref:Chain length determinant protein n=1 Tax=Pedobacter nyackensis TaxID=475255 RepID=A0A1W2C0U1_9SPHI|nr:lipopolysaccharide biosynthesis protein [Pedobacter nyackensis]SMC78845.1 Chain length determinant protein [Pedobacter nyackensis]